MNHMQLEKESEGREVGAVGKVLATPPRMGNRAS